MRSARGAAGAQVLGGLAALSMAGAALLSRAFGGPSPSPSRAAASVFPADPLASGASRTASPSQPASQAQGESLGAAAPRKTPEAPFDPSALSSGLGGQASSVLDELVRPGLRHLAALARAAEPAVPAALPPLRCLSNDIREDIRFIQKTYDPPSIGLTRDMQKLEDELSSEGDGLLAKMNRAQADLVASEACMTQLAGSSVDSLSAAAACHDRLEGALSSLRLIDQELANFWPTVQAGWSKADAALRPIAFNPSNPDHAKALLVLSYMEGAVVSASASAGGAPKTYVEPGPASSGKATDTGASNPLHGQTIAVLAALPPGAEAGAGRGGRSSVYGSRLSWYKLHPEQARAGLRSAAAPAEEAPALAAQARIWKAKVERAAEPFADAYRKAAPILQSWQRARDAALSLDLSERGWSLGGPQGRTSEVEGSREAVRALVELRESVRLLPGAPAGDRP